VLHSLKRPFTPPTARPASFSECHFQKPGNVFAQVQSFDQPQPGKRGTDTISSLEAFSSWFSMSVGVSSS